MASEEPRRAKERRDKDEPMLEKSSTAIAEPKRAQLRSAMDDPS